MEDDNQCLSSEDGLDLPNRVVWLEKYIENFMFHDVQVCLDGDANFAAALMLSVYTEFIGGLINGTVSDNEGVGRENYKTFLNKMGYIDSSKNTRYYYKIRCGLAHQYFIKDGEHGRGVHTLAT